MINHPQATDDDSGEWLPVLCSVNLLKFRRICSCCVQISSSPCYATPDRYVPRPSTRLPTNDHALERLDSDLFPLHGYHKTWYDGGEWMSEEDAIARYEIYASTASKFSTSGLPEALGEGAALSC